MQVSLQRKQVNSDFEMVMKENEEDLALFLDLQKRENDANGFNLIHNVDDFDGSNQDSSPISKILSSMPARKTATEEFLNSENGKADYDWLLAPPGGAPLFPTLEMDMQKPTLHQKGIPSARPIALMARPVNSLSEPLVKSNLRQASSTPTLTVSNAGNRRSSSAGRASTNFRPSTPIGRHTIPAIAKPSRPSTPNSRPSVLSINKTATSGVRSSTPTRPIARSSTPTRPIARSSTPTARLSLPASKPTSRSATPTRRSSTPSSFPGASFPPNRSVIKSAPASRNPIMSRGASPPVKSRPWKPSEMPGFPVDAPPNLRTSMSERPSSATKSRPGAPNTHPSPVEAGTKRNPKQQPRSPSRIYGNGGFVPTRSQGHSNSIDHVNPGLIGTQMVERVINMRRLAPPKQDDRSTINGNSAGKSSSSVDSSGFGRTLSNKSLDMAMRHMDIRRTVSGNLRPILTKIPASSMYSVRSGDSKSGTFSVSGSPFATSSSASSSEPSVNHNISYFNEREMGDDDYGSEKGISSLSIHQGR